MQQNNIIPAFGWEQNLAFTAGMSLSQIRFAISFFLSVAVGIVFRYVPTVKGRHLYSLVTGLALIYYPFGNGVFHAFVPSLLTYFAMRRIRQHCGTLGWLVTFPYLLVCHVVNASGTAWKDGAMDFTGAQMVLTLKVISAAVCYHDGLFKAEELKPYQEAKKLTRLPSLLEFFSYIFQAGNLLAGPHSELRDYLTFVERRGVWDPKAPKPMPSPWAAGGLRFLKALAMIALHLYLSSYLPITVLGGPWYNSLSVPTRLVVMWVVVVIYRFKYYFAWALAEASLIFSGLCFDGWDEATGKAKWTRYINARIRKVELGTSAAPLAGHWNVCTGNWLRQYVYERLTPMGRKPGFVNMLATQVVSGLWHGLFPGYLLFFVSSAFLFDTSKIIFRYEANWPASLINNPLYTLAKFIYTGFTLNYIGTAFLVLTWSESIELYSSVYFAGHIAMAAIVAVSLVMPPRKPKKAQSMRQSSSKVTLDAMSEPTLTDPLLNGGEEQPPADKKTE